jgi:hypothetical protein
MDLGFSQRHARFLLHVLVFSGVFIERQYRAFTGVAHGQKTHDFLARLVADGYATPVTPGAVHRGRLYHVHYKPLYEAIGEPNNWHRKTASLGRCVERLMLLDAVLAEPRYTWLGTEQDKLRYFLEYLERDLLKGWYPQLAFGTPPDVTTRYFPEKLPIGVPRDGGRRHLFLYLVTRDIPSEFRLFLLRHADLLQAVDEWTIRILLPRRFRRAAALYRYAVRDALMLPIAPDQVNDLDWYFRYRQGHVVCPSRDRDLDIATARRRFGAARFDAIFRTWQQRSDQALWAVQSHILKEHLQRGDGRIEFAELPHQYLQLTPLVGRTDGVDRPDSSEDDLTHA